MVDHMVDQAGPWSITWLARRPRRWSITWLTRRARGQSHGWPGGSVVDHMVDQADAWSVTWLTRRASGRSHGWPREWADTRVIDRPRTPHRPPPGSPRLPQAPPGCLVEGSALVVPAARHRRRQLKMKPSPLLPPHPLRLHVRRKPRPHPPHPHPHPHPHLRRLLKSSILTTMPGPLCSSIA